jgi:hypothetical protein
MANPWEEYQTPSGAPVAAVSVEPWTEYEDAVIAAPSREDKVSNFQYIANQAKLGLTDSLVLGEAIIDTFAIDPVANLFGKGEKGGIGERFSKNVKRLQKAAGTVTGAQPDMTAPSAAAEIVGSGARMLTDPLGYIGTGALRSGATVVERAAPVVGRAAGLFGMGAAAGGGGIVGQEVEKQLTGEDTGTGKAIGQVAGIAAGIVPSAALETSISTLSNFAKQLKSKYDMVKADPDAASKSYATGAAKRLIDLIAKSTPSKNLDAIMDEFRRVGQVVGTGDVPLLVAMSDNPIVQTEVSRLVKTNPGVRQEIDSELTTFLQNVDQKSVDIFGNRYTPVSGVKTPLTTQINKNIKLREAVDTKLDDLATRFPEPDNVQIGLDTQRLIEVRSKAAKAEMTPVYDAIKEGAKKAGAVLPDTGVRDIHSFVVANNMQDIFGRKTRLDNLITKNFAPQNGEYFPTNFDSVISLKEEINRVQRSVKMDDVAKMRLNELEDVVDAARQQIPGNWNQALQNADKAYYERIGIPFGAQGIKDIDAKKYADQVAPQIVKSPETLRQFIKAGGNDGVLIADNAIMSEVYKKVIKNDAVDPRALSKYIKDKSAVIDQIPGMRQKLEATLLDDSVLKLTRKDLDDKVALAQKQVADNFILSVKDSDGISIPNYSELASRLFTDPRFFGKINKDLAMVDKPTSKAVMRNIQAEVLEKARNSTDGGIGFLTSPKNKAVIEKVFGKGYQQEVKDILTMSDALQKADISKVTASIKTGDLDVLGQIVPGLDVPFVASTLRDKISSHFQKAVRLLSRAKTAQLRTDTDNAIKELLMDRDGMRKVLEAKNTMDFKLQNPASIKQVIDALDSTLPRYMYGIVKETTMQEPPPAPPEPTVQFGTFQ